MEQKIGETVVIPTELQKFLRVNSCETPNELISCILDFADENGNIKGRVRIFDAKKMAEHARYYFDSKEVEFFSPNVITREYGLRQQAMYIKHYYKK